MNPITWPEYFLWLAIVLASVAAVVLLHWYPWLVLVGIAIAGAVLLWRWGCKKMENILPTFREKE